MRVLLTGGAGYVGSHAAQALVRAGHDVTILDNLLHGHRQAVAGLPLLEVDLCDGPALAAALKRGRFDAVLHCAGLIFVGESMRDPARYYRVNVVGGLNLLDAMVACGCRRLIFSSTAAVYGIPERTPIPEDHPARPISTYGQTKLEMERALRWYAAAGLLGAVSLRYFNAAGAAEDARIGEDHRPEEHLIPLVLQVALGQREAVSIFGRDYDTPDGTCVRDYIHVEDLAAAHVLALEAVEPGMTKAYNVGTGSGHSVREVIEMARAVTNHLIPVHEAPPRPGDVPTLVAAAEAIARDLGWRPRSSDLRHIIDTAWAWHRTHPGGFHQK
jgi:UDP-glucose 4-epimerase